MANASSARRSEYLVHPHGRPVSAGRPRMELASQTTHVRRRRPFRVLTGRRTWSRRSPRREMTNGASDRARKNAGAALAHRRSQTRRSIRANDPVLAESEACRQTSEEPAMREETDCGAGIHLALARAEDVMRTLLDRYSTGTIGETSNGTTKARLVTSCCGRWAFPLHCSF